MCIIGLVFFTWLLIRPESLPKQSVRSTAESVTVGNYCDQADKYFNRFNPKDNQTAIDIWRNAIQAHPGYPCPLAGLAKGYAISHLRFGASQSLAQQALLLADNAIQLGPQRPDGYLAKGLAYQALGQYSLALEAYKQSSRKEPRWNMPVRFSAQVLERKGDLAGAYRKSVDAIAINHCDPMSYQELGSVLSILGFEQRADQAYTKAVQFKPDFFTARVSRARYQLDDDRVDNAMHEAQKLIAEAPDFPATQQLLADIYLFAGDSVAASTHYRSLLSSAPRFSLYAQVRLAAIEDSRNEQLETTLRTLMQEQPEVREWPYYLALLNAQWNNKTIALEYLSAAIEKGWLYAASTERDPVLASLAREPEFQAVLATIKSRVKTAAEEVETLLSDESASCDQFLLLED
jgi:tetratricopeptide (TPR) repeat protein